MRSHLHDDPCLGILLGQSPEAFPVVGDRSLIGDVTVAFDRADGVLLISEVNTDSRGWNGRFHKAASGSHDAHASLAAFSSNLVSLFV